MTDEQLLEAAAKAAGLELTPTGCVWDNERAEMVPWNPLKDDGDALRLAVAVSERICDGFRLSLIDINDEFVTVDRYNPMEWKVSERDNDRRDPCAATRLAIVRAAASISPPQ